MERIIKFLGKHMFFPVIIHVCQWTRCNQYLFYRVMFCLAYLFIAAQAVENGHMWVAAFFIPVFIAAVIITYYKWDVPSQGSVGLTFFFLVCAVIVTVLDLAVGHSLKDNLFSYFALFAEYARLLTTIPPAETKKKEATFSKKATNDA